MNKSFYFFIFILCASSFSQNCIHAHEIKNQSNKVDLVVYSYNRPIQLYALLESLETYVTGAGQIAVIYKAGNTKYSRAYKQVASDFPAITFFEQNNAVGGRDFKPLTKQCAFDSPHEYVGFLVDDIIITDEIDLEYCVQMLKKTDAYGFYLRLGKNITYCFMTKEPSPVPQHTHIQDDVYMWKFRDGVRFDWNYPNSVDMVVYKKNDIRKDILSMSLQSPTFESAWHRKADSNKFGLFFEHSKIVNITVNLVRNDKNWGQFTSEWRQKMNEYTPEKLLEKFNSGFKINIAPFYKIDNRAPHMESEFTFIKH